MKFTAGEEERHSLDQIPAAAGAFLADSRMRLNNIQPDDRTLAELRALRSANGYHRTRVLAWRNWLAGRLAALKAQEDAGSGPLA